MVLMAGKGQLLGLDSHFPPSVVIAKQCIPGQLAHRLLHVSPDSASYLIRVVLEFQMPTTASLILGPFMGFRD